jgi:hypothetical protein
MYLAAILSLLHTLQLVVPQVVCGDVRCLFQKSRTAEEGNGTIVLGLPVLHQFLFNIWSKGEPETERSERQSGRPPGEDGQQHHWAGRGAGVDTVEETVKKAEKAVEKVEKTVTDMAKELESGMYQEMRAREAIKRNLVIYGVKEPDQRLTDSKDKMEADKDECEKIFIATGSKARKSDIRFCRRLGEKGEDKEKPVLLGIKSETIKCEVLDQVKELRNTVYKDVGIGPDQKTETDRNRTEGRSGQED